MHGWYRVSLLLLLLSVALPAGARSLCPGGQAQRASLDGVQAMSQQDDAAAVRHFEQAGQCAPTQTVYARALALARRTLLETHL